MRHAEPTTSAYTRFGAMRASTAMAGTRTWKTAPGEDVVLASASARSSRAERDGAITGTQTL